MKETKRSIILPIITALLSVCMVICFICYASKGFVDDKVNSVTEQVNTVSGQITAINGSIDELKAADTELNGYIDALETAVAKCESDLAAINAKITELEESLDGAEYATTVLAQLNTLKTATESDIATLKTDVAALKAKDTELANKITALETTVATLASKDWANATFATLEQYTSVQTEISGIKTSISSVNASITALETKLNNKIATDITAAIDDLSAELSDDYVAKITAATNNITTAYTGAIATAKTEITNAYTAAISSAIATSEASMKAWVNSTLADGYYTIAQIDAKIETLEADDADLSADISALETALANAKTELTNKYTAAITQAINDNNGVIDTQIANAIATAKSELNASITAIELRVATLETKVEEHNDKIAELETRINCLEGNHNIAVSYTWADDYSTCTATGVCAKCGTVTETVNAIKNITQTYYNCEIPEISSFIAIFTNDNFAVQIQKDVQTRMVGDHQYSGGVCVDCGCTAGLFYGPFSDSYYVSMGSATATDIVIPSYYNGLPVTDIAYSGFSASTYANATSITSVYIPDTVTAILNGAFYGCTALKEITIPDSVTEIGTGAFYDCEALTTVYYTGSAEEWSEVTIANNNTYLTSATVYYYSESQPTDTTYKYWRYVNGVPTPWTT